MSAEELVLAAEFRLKELDAAGAAALLDKALERDAGLFARARAAGDRGVHRRAIRGRVPQPGKGDRARSVCR